MRELINNPISMVILLSIFPIWPWLAEKIVRKLKLPPDFITWLLFAALSIILLTAGPLMVFINIYLGLVLNVQISNFLDQPLTGAGLIVYSFNAFFIFGLWKWFFYPTVRDFEQFKHEWRQTYKKLKYKKKSGINNP